ncbi:hypothetical protein Pcinc_010318 [Petrolisthes cinctipes]|uniref:RNA helicase n=1 Tax=Petrolisthes cinctipes TaxID=88211 RepID=A0AAE1KXI8_PETCI|nr:hypothetical protein Pcinc_010318 [Petrolisthes cinctipes]
MEGTEKQGRSLPQRHVALFVLISQGTRTLQTHYSHPKPSSGSHTTLIYIYLTKTMQNRRLLHNQNMVSEREGDKNKPDIVVGTPTRVLKHITAGNLTVKDSLKMLVIDEADLMFTFEYLGDIEAVLKYRAKDAWNRCTSIAILETRKKELKRELLHSEKLQTFFKDHPKDLQALRHDNPKHNLTPLKRKADPLKSMEFSGFKRKKT